MYIQQEIGSDKFNEFVELATKVKELNELYAQQKRELIYPAIKKIILRKMDWDEETTELEVEYSTFDKVYMVEAKVKNDPNARYVFSCPLKASGIITVDLNFREAY